MTSTELAIGRFRLSHRTVRVILLILPVWILGAGELSQFVQKNAVIGPFERTGLVKGRDFVQFYVAGTLVRQGRWRELYDVEALQKAVATIVPAADRIVPAPGYPPHVALFFSPWARLGYLDARWVWFAVSSTAYLAGTAVIIHGVAPLRDYRSLAWTTAVFSPLLAMALTTGQLSTAAMLFWALATAAFSNRRRLLCGVCLGLLAYKPSLLLGVVLVLMVTGTWTILGGVMLSAAGQFCASLPFLGFQPWQAYATSAIAFPQYYYLTDTLPHQKQSLLGFFQLLAGSGILAACLAIVAGIVVLALWRRHRDQTESRWFMPMLAASSVLLSPHLYVYDLVVLTPALLIVAGALAPTWATLNERVLAWSSYALLYAPYSGSVAIYLRLQVSTIVLVAFLVAVHRQWLSDTRGANA